MSRDRTPIDRRRLLKAAGGIGIIGLAGCVGEEPEDENGEENGDDETPDEGGEQLVFVAGGADGTYFPLAGEIKNIVDAETPHVLTVQESGASVENAGSLADESADFVLIQNDIAFFASEGTGIDDFEGNPVENIRGVASLYPETIHIVTPADANIETLEDLEGGTVNTGDLGSGTQVNALQILETVGLEPGEDFTEDNSDFGSAADQIRDNAIDASFIVGGWPVGAVEELAQTTDIEIIQLDAGTREALLEDAEWLSEDTIPEGTYDGIEEDVDTVAVQAMIATHEGVDEGIVEEVTTAIFENVDEIDTQGEFIDEESAQEAMSVELHPGAEAYFG